MDIKTAPAVDLIKAIKQPLSLYVIQGIKKKRDNGSVDVLPMTYVLIELDEEDKTYLYNKYKIKAENSLEGIKKFADEEIQNL